MTYPATIYTDGGLLSRNPSAKPAPRRRFVCKGVCGKCGLPQWLRLKDTVGEPSFPCVCGGVLALSKYCSGCCHFLPFSRYGVRSKDGTCRDKCKVCDAAKTTVYNRAHRKERNIAKKRRHSRMKAAGMCIGCNKDRGSRFGSYCHDCIVRRCPHRKYAAPCVYCGFPFADVHHIDGNGKNNEANNCIPLCPNHHRMVHMGILKVDGVEAKRAFGSYREGAKCTSRSTPMGA